MLAPQTPVSLLERLRLKPDEASVWERLFQLYRPLLERWMERFALQPADRDDLVQDVLLVLLRELPQFQHSGQPGAFRKWLRLVTVHRCQDRLRSGKTRPAAVGEAELAKALEQLTAPDSELARRWDEEHNRHVARRMLELIAVEFEPSTQHAFRRLVLEDGDARTVAGELGMSVNAVYIAKSRVLQRLRQEIRGLVD
jgi:RNA polymerase sigma-70 factor (ECF subfamily)